MKDEFQEKKLSLKGKNCLVTGATSGIGLATACALASLGATVTGLGRDRTRADRALDSVRKAARAGRCDTGSPGEAAIRFDIVDLADLGSVARYAASKMADLRFAPKLDILVNCAGVYTDKRIATVDGYELQFVVNHLAHYCLTTRLLPLLAMSQDARVITVSSGSHYNGRIRWNELERDLHREASRGLYIGIQAYGQSKLSNVLFSDSLARRYRDTTITFFTADPGLVNTDMGAKQDFSVGSLFWSLRRRGGTCAELPAQAIAWLAAEPSLKGRSGLYWRDRALREPSRRGRNQVDADRLWDLSERMVVQALAAGNTYDDRVPVGEKP